MKTPDLRALRSKRDIQAGFIQMLKQKSFDEVTINDICATGLVGRSTFYHHYVDKYALLDALVTERASQFDKLLSKRMRSVDQDQLLVALYTALADDAEVITTLLTVHTPTADLSECYRRSLKQHLTTLWPGLKLAVSVPQEFMREFYANSALLALTWALKNGDQVVIAKFMNQLVQKILVG